MKKIIVTVPENTIPYKCGERFMICEYNGEIKKCIAFFKTWDEFCKSEYITECEDYTKKLKVLAV